MRHQVHGTGVSKASKRYLGHHKLFEMPEKRRERHHSTGQVSMSRTHGCAVYYGAWIPTNPVSTRMRANYFNTLVVQFRVTNKLSIKVQRSMRDFIAQCIRLHDPLPSPTQAARDETLDSRCFHTLRPIAHSLQECDFCIRSTLLNTRQWKQNG